MKKLIFVTMIIFSLSLAGCGKQSATVTAPAETPTPVAEVQAKADAEIQKAKEKAYYDSVMSGLTKHVIATQNFISKLSNYSSAKPLKYVGIYAK